MYNMCARCTYFTYVNMYIRISARGCDAMQPFRIADSILFARVGEIFSKGRLRGSLFARRFRVYYYCCCSVYMKKVCGRNSVRFIVFGHDLTHPATPFSPSSPSPTLFSTPFCRIVNKFLPFRNVITAPHPSAEASAPRTLGKTSRTPTPSSYIKISK